MSKKSFASKNSFWIGFVLFAALSNVAVAEPAPAPYRGWVAVEQELQSRWGGNGSTRFDLGSFLGVPNGSADRALLNLLGATQDGSSEFRGGIPGGLNFFLWYMTFDRVSSEIVELCGEVPATVPFLSPEARLGFLDACKLSRPEIFYDSDSRQVNGRFYDLWLLSVGFAVPFTEFEFWLTQWKALDPALPPGERLQQMLVLAWMNPYFLLQN